MYAVAVHGSARHSFAQRRILYYGGHQLFAQPAGEMGWFCVSWTNDTSPALVACSSLFNTAPHRARSAALLTFILGMLFCLALCLFRRKEGGGSRCSYLSAALPLSMTLLCRPPEQAGAELSISPAASSTWTGSRVYGATWACLVSFLHCLPSLLCLPPTRPALWTIHLLWFR